MSQGHARSGTRAFLIKLAYKYTGLPTDTPALKDVKSRSENLLNFIILNWYIAAFVLSRLLTTGCKKCGGNKKKGILSFKSLKEEIAIEKPSTSKML